MSGVRSGPMGGKSTLPKKDSTKQQGVVLLNGLPLRTTYLANCRLCLSDRLGKGSISIMDKQFTIMLNHVFRFPIAFKKGLSMKVCTECYKGVERFYGYTYKVLGNQKTLEETMIPDQLSKQSNSSVHARARHSDTNRGKGKSGVIEIASYDELKKSKDDNMIDVDMQCESASDDEEDRRDASSQPSNYETTQTHFVAVPALEDIFLVMDSDGNECIKKTYTKPVEDAPFVIELISASDDEYEESAENESITNSNNRTRNANLIPGTIRKSQSNAGTSSQPFAAIGRTVTKLDKPKNNVPGFVTLIDLAIIRNGSTDAGISPKNSTTTALESRCSVRNTDKLQNTSNSVFHFPRRSFN
ncbi:uncharacterized protein LOC128303174 [Anopheles moucheti]|uniref:uncharacterized protein LOC128303174 n=1 Tax=Anopheles moucheti TaxID=186751 RepID=UPI0022F091DC|nr:uncharacterized protein LOC128303174 [Anopheles moucheti]